MVVAEVVGFLEVGFLVVGFLVLVLVGGVIIFRLIGMQPLAPEILP